LDKAFNREIANCKQIGCERMSFDTQGFLDKDMDILSNAIFNKNIDIFNFCYKVNEFGHKVKAEMKIDLDNSQHLVICLFFIRILRIFQTTVILSKLGLNSEAKIIVRSSLEATFVLLSVKEDKGFADKLIETDLVDLRKYLETNKSQVSDDNDDLYELIKNRAEKKYHAIVWAKRSDKLTTYDLAYRSLSRDVHNHIITLKGDLLETEGYTNKLIYKPDDKDIKTTILTGYYALINAINVVCEISELDYDLFIDELTNEQIKLFK
jgi:hypothetical protein